MSGAIKNGQPGSGVQIWSTLPLETTGDYRELGYVHASNHIEAWDCDQFPHEQAHAAYLIGYAAGLYFRFGGNEYDCQREYFNAGITATQQNDYSYGRFLGGNARLAYAAGCAYEHHKQIYARTIKPV